MKGNIQSYPAADSPSTDALEGLVETYYQLNGFITSSSKWFWVLEPGNSKRGYQDIDVLALSAQETIIVSVTSDLSDKISLNPKHAERSLNKLNGFFDRSKRYLDQVEEYRWTTSEPRRVRYVLVYGSGNALAKKTHDVLQSNNIELMPVTSILKWFRTEMDRYLHEGLRTNNQPLKLMQLLVRKGTFADDQASKDSQV